MRPVGCSTMRRSFQPTSNRLRYVNSAGAESIRFVRFDRFDRFDHFDHFDRQTVRWMHRKLIVDCANYTLSFSACEDVMLIPSSSERVGWWCFHALNVTFTPIRKISNRPKNREPSFRCLLNAWFKKASDNRLDAKNRFVRLRKPNGPGVCVHKSLWTIFIQSHLDKVRFSSERPSFVRQWEAHRLWRTA